MDFDIHTHYNLKIDKALYVKGGKIGLKNDYLMCYMNSIVHCLNNSLPLTDFLLQSKSDKKNSTYSSFVNLLYTLQSSNFNTTARGLVKSLDLDFSIQYDAHEIMIAILEKLHKALKYDIECDIVGEALNESDNLIVKSYNSWIKEFSKDYSFINQMFYGMTFKKCTCSENIEFGHYNTIFLDVSESLYKSLDDQFSFNKDCSMCRKPNESVKLWTLPDNLIINFKRYNEQNRKIESFMDYPVDIDLTKYISNEKNDPNKYVYYLYGVICHSGSTDSGHYWCYCRDITNTWYKYDDCNVEKVYDIGEIIRVDAYILFYQRSRIINI